MPCSVREPRVHRGPKLNRHARRPTHLAVRTEATVLFALTLVHEFLHVQLGALLDLVPLHGPASPARYHAPWRPDPRPLDALLQCTYAHLGVCDFWHTERSTAAPSPRAGREHATWYGYNRGAVDTLLGSGELLPAGRRFTEGMRAALARLGGD
ncbi:aKG-HExxH-type peptide beta-hydroxylase [Streptomyces sp. NPDC001507]|uniref:aKG-HExxH-type peptide beta-hydroxylase n=1 Tax=Streptomyces sp. NPDC001507 TaxID=3364579 RepID=UPI0036A04EF2